MYHWWCAHAIGKPLISYKHCTASYTNISIHDHEEYNAASALNPALCPQALHMQNTLERKKGHD